MFSGGRRSRMSVALHEEENLGKAYDTRLLLRLWRYVKPYWLQVLCTLLLVAPMFALEIGQPYLVKQGIDTFMAQHGTIEQAPSGLDRTIELLGVDTVLEALLIPRMGIPPLAWLACLYLIFALGLGLMQYLHMLLMTTTGQNAMRDLRKDSFDRIQKLHMGFFDSYPVGRVVTRTTNDVENIAEMFSAGIVALITDIAKMVGFGFVLWLEMPELAWKAFLVVPFLTIAAAVFRWKVRDAFRDVRVRIARINAHIQEVVTGMKVVQLFTREERNMRDFDEMNAKHRDAWQRSIHYDALLFATVEAASQMTIAIILWAGTGIATPGVLYFFIDLMRRFFMPLRDLSAKYSVMQSSMASAERIFQLIDTEDEVRDPAAGRPPGRSSFRKRLVLVHGRGGRLDPARRVVPRCARREGGSRGRDGGGQDDDHQFAQSTLRDSARLDSHRRRRYSRDAAGRITPPHCNGASGCVPVQRGGGGQHRPWTEQYRSRIDSPRGTSRSGRPLH